jgi:hypothetical protein
VENVPVDSWKSYIETGNDWSLRLLEKCPNDFKLTMTSNALQAAVALIDGHSAELNTSQRARLRKLVSHFNIHAERKLLDTIVAQIPYHAESAFGLIKALSEEASAAVASHFNSETLVKLLAGISMKSGGRAWLETQTDAFQSAIKRLDRSSKAEVRAWFRSARKEKPKARGDWIEKMAHRLGF